MGPPSLSGQITFSVLIKSYIPAAASPTKSKGHASCSGDLFFDLSPTARSKLNPLLGPSIHRPRSSEQTHSPRFSAPPNLRLISAFVPHTHRPFLNCFRPSRADARHLLTTIFFIMACCTFVREKKSTRKCTQATQICYLH